MSIWKVYSHLDLLNFINSNSEIYIYGAGDVAHIFLGCFSQDYPKMQVRGIFVKSEENNPCQINNIPVMELVKVQHFSRDIKIVVAVGEKFHKEILEILLENSFTNIALLCLNYEIYLRQKYCFMKIKNEFMKLGNEYLVELYDGDKYQCNVYDKNSIRGLYWKFRLSNQVDSIETIQVLKEKNLYHYYYTYSGINSSLDFELKNILTDTNISKISKIDFQIFMVVNIADKHFVDTNDEYLNKSWIHLIQTGSANTKERRAEILDCLGENISKLNPYFSETTATYWMWKNAKKSKYIGLCHYRRRFLLTDMHIQQLLKSDIDVILLFPEIVVPNNKIVFTKNFLKESDWGIVLQVIQKKAPEYYETAVKHGKSVFLHPCNMFIAKWEIFCEYAEWLFSITLDVYQYCEMHHITHDNRFLGYISENLQTIFFIKNAKKYKIVCCDEQFTE